MKSITRTEQKCQLREKLKGQERRLTKAALSASNRALTERFLSLAEVAAAKTILLFCSMGAEPDTTRLLQELTARGKRIALPRCLPGGEMETRIYTASEPLIRHSYGMLEPGDAHLLIGAAAIDLALVPALAYDCGCKRLGRGGGYYDRYLARFSGVTVGLCRDVLLQADLPCEPHDQPVDLVLTETRLFRRGGKSDDPETGKRSE